MKENSGSPYLPRLCYFNVLNKTRTREILCFFVYFIHQWDSMNVWMNMYRRAAKRRWEVACNVCVVLIYGKRFKTVEFKEILCSVQANLSPLVCFTALLGWDLIVKSTEKSLCISTRAAMRFELVWWVTCKFDRDIIISPETCWWDSAKSEWKCFF